MSIVRPAILTLSLFLAFACGDSKTDEDDDDGSGATGGSAGSGGSGGSAGGTAGGGGAVDRCPEVCAKLQTLFDSFECPLDDCACKPACADLFEESIDCIPPGDPACTCQSNGELDCSNLCEEENAAANECYQTH